MRGVAKRHHHCLHPPGAQRLHRDGEGEGRIDTAGQSQHHTPEAVFVDVVAHTQDQSLPGGCNFRLGRAHGQAAQSRRRPGEVRLQPVITLLEVGSRGDHPAGRIDGKGAAIENQLILPAHLVDIDDGQPGLPGAPGQQLPALLALAAVVGG